VFPLAVYAVLRIPKGSNSFTWGFTGEQREPVSLDMGLRARSKVSNLGFRSPAPQIVCVESGAEEIGRKESELRRSHSDETYDDAVCSRYKPALP
jgi:hypothetical protein